MLAAGSLAHTIENGLRPAVDATLEAEYRGSAEIARLVAADGPAPDIVSLADTALFDSPMDAAWYGEFATNAMVVTYDANTAAGKRLAEAGPERWYEPVLAGEVTLGRTDPDVDPLGYRTLFVLELLDKRVDAEVDLRAAVADEADIYPETQLMSQFETGSVDAAVTYRNMAVERGYDYLDLPAAVDLGDPANADTYATTSYELPDGTVVEGGVISYGTTGDPGHPAVESVLRNHLSGTGLTEFGFGVPDRYPIYTGNVPETVRV